MFVPILVFALLVVCPVIAITFPNGFTFDETSYFNIKPRANVLEKCEHPDHGCKSDCSAYMECDGNYTVTDATKIFPCSQIVPFCVKTTGYYSTCSGNFPMSSQACLTRAIDNFICTADGQFPDITDCSKYHVCNGSSHTIEECPTSTKFTFDQQTEDLYTSTNPGNGEFSCLFRNDHVSCMCERFYCGKSSTYCFRAMDYFHYAYALEIKAAGRTVIFMFKCPKGTRHNGELSKTNSVDCFPIDASLA